MDDCRYWIYVKNRTSDEYLKGLDNFIAIAEDMRNRDKTSMLLPMC